MATRVRFIDIYSLYNEIDANIIENLLADFDIECRFRQGDFSTNGHDREDEEKIIAVEEDNVADAKDIILNAIKSGVISADGRFEA